MFILLSIIHSIFSLEGYNVNKNTVDELSNDNYGIKVYNNTQFHSYDTESTSVLKEISDTSTGYSIKLHAKRTDLHFEMDDQSLFITFELKNEHMQTKNKMRIDVLENKLKNFYTDEINENNDALTVVHLVFEKPGNAKLNISKNFNSEFNS